MQTITFAYYFIECDDNYYKNITLILLYLMFVVHFNLITIMYKMNMITIETKHIARKTYNV